MGKEEKNRNPLKNCSAFVYLSTVICGLGCIVRKQFAKGLLYLFAEILVILYMINAGIYNLRKQI